MKRGSNSVKIMNRTINTTVNFILHPSRLLVCRTRIHTICQGECTMYTLTSTLEGGLVLSWKAEHGWYLPTVQSFAKWTLLSCWLLWGIEEPGFPVEWCNNIHGSAMGQALCYVRTYPAQLRGWLVTIWAQWGSDKENYWLTSAEKHLST